MAITKGHGGWRPRRLGDKVRMYATRYICPLQRKGYCSVEEDTAAFEAADIQLCAGLLGMRGASEARYTMISLSRSLAKICTNSGSFPEVVQRTTRALACCNAEEEIAHYSKDAIHPLAVGEIQYLHKSFQVCAARGLGLIAIM